METISRRAAKAAQSARRMFAIEPSSPSDSPRMSDDRKKPRVQPTKQFTKSLWDQNNDLMSKQKTGAAGAQDRTRTSSETPLAFKELISARSTVAERDGSGHRDRWLSRQTSFADKTKSLEKRDTEGFRGVLQSECTRLQDTLLQEYEAANQVLQTQLYDLETDFRMVCEEYNHICTEHDIQIPAKIKKKVDLHSIARTFLGIQRSIRPAMAGCISKATSSVGCASLHDLRSTSVDGDLSKQGKKRGMSMSQEMMSFASLYSEDFAIGHGRSSMDAEDLQPLQDEPTNIESFAVGGTPRGARSRKSHADSEQIALEVTAVRADCSPSDDMASAVDAPDFHCLCRLQGKSKSDWRKLMWNTPKQLNGFQQTDDIEFLVLKGEDTYEDVLGRAFVFNAEFHPDGYDDVVAVMGSDGKKHAYLNVRIKVIQKGHKPKIKGILKVSKTSPSLVEDSPAPRPPPPPPSAIKPPPLDLLPQYQNIPDSSPVSPPAPASLQSCLEEYADSKAPNTLYSAKEVVCSNGDARDHERGRHLAGEPNDDDEDGELSSAHGSHLDKATVGTPSITRLDESAKKELPVTDATSTAENQTASTNSSEKKKDLEPQLGVCSCVSVDEMPPLLGIPDTDKNLSSSDTPNGQRVLGTPRPLVLDQSIRQSSLDSNPCFQSGLDNSKLLGGAQRQPGRVSMLLPSSGQSRFSISVEAPSTDRCSVLSASSSAGDRGSVRGSVADDHATVYADRLSRGVSFPQSEGCVSEWCTGSQDGEGARFRMWNCWLEANFHSMQMQHEAEKGKASVHSRIAWFMSHTKFSHPTAIENDSDDEEEAANSKTHSCIPIVHPQSAKRIMWEFLSLIVVGYDCVIIPLQFFPIGEHRSFHVIEWLVRIFWTLDLPLAFITGYMRRNGSVEMRGWAAASHYMRTWFPLDGTVLAVDWAEVILGSVGVLSAARMGKTLKSLRMIRVLRILKLTNLRQLPESIRALEYYFRSELAEIGGGIFQIFIFMIWLNHALACCWYGIGDGDDASHSWLDVAQSESYSLGYMYLTSYHWALCQFAGSMEIAPVNATERCFAVLSLFFAFFVSASVVSSITSSMTRLEIATAHVASKISSLKKYLYDNNISSKVALRVERDAQHVLAREQQSRTGTSIELLSMISSSLQREVHFEIYMPKIRCHPFFEEYAASFPGVMKQVCHQAVNQMTLMRGDMVFTEGEIPPIPHMYFVMSGGKLTYHMMSNETGQATVVQIGDWACEAVLFTPWIHCGTLRVKADCTMLVLDAEVFQSIVARSEIQGLPVYAYGTRFVSWLNTASEEELTDLWDPSMDLVAMLDYALPHRSDTTVIKIATLRKMRRSLGKLLKSSSKLNLNTSHSFNFRDPLKMLRASTAR